MFIHDDFFLISRFGYILELVEIDPVQLIF